MSDRTIPIIHSVIFSLKHAPGSKAEARFLEDGRRLLSAIPSVNDFKLYRQVSPKNDYRFGFSMRFDDSTGYEAYNVHPDHVAFVQERWNVEVERFLEIDYEER